MKKILLLLVFVSTLFLSSCIKMDSNLVVNNDLTISWETIFDYTQLNATAWWFSASFDLSWSWSFEKKEVKKTMPCDNLKSGTGWLSMWLFKNPKCINVDDNIAKVIWDSWDISKFLSKINWNYKLILKWISESNSSDDWKTEEEKIQSINMLKTMWFEMNYNITMPSDIIESNVWIINWKILSFSVYDIIDEKDPYVIFEDNWSFSDINTEKNNELVLISKVKLFKKLILSKRELEKTYEWRKDIQKFDKYIPLMKDEKLIKIYNKLSKVNLKSYKFKKYKNILEYLNAKIGLELYKRK